MLPSLTDVVSQAPPNSKSDSVIEVDFLFTRWRQIRSQLTYAELFEGSLFSRFRLWWQLQKDCQFESQNYLNHKLYRVPHHSLKKDLMALFRVPSQNIEVTPSPSSTAFDSALTSTLDNDKRLSLRKQINCAEDDVVLFLVDEPNLLNGIYQALLTTKYLKDEKIEHVKLLIQESESSKPLRKQIKDLDITNQVVFAPSEKAQIELLSLCDIAFLPALYAPQTDALKTAMACQCPVVLSDDVGGLEDHLKVLKPYVFTSGTQTPVVANLLIPLIRSQSLRQQVGQDNREEIKSTLLEVHPPGQSQNSLSPVEPPKA